MTGGSERRAFLREMFGGAARAAMEGARAARAIQGVPAGQPADTEAETGGLGEEDARADAPVVPMPTRCATRAELARMVVEAGLAHREAAILALARETVRLEPIGDALRGARDMHVGIRLWEIEFAAEHPMPASDGLLSFSWQREPGVSTSPRPASPGHVVLAGRAPDASGANEAATFRYAPELTLPRVWSAVVADLDLVEGEQAAWEDVRVRLAGTQGTVPVDSVTGHPEVSRLLGYPDERTGDMPLICELLARGHETDEGGPLLHPAASELAAESRRWQLLLQLDRGSAATEEWRRLYYWIDRADLARGDFGGTWVVAR